jgi:hypothetical protein
MINTTQFKQGDIYFYAYRKPHNKKITILKLEFNKVDNGFLFFKVIKRTGFYNENCFFIPLKEEYLNKLERGF